MTIRTVLGSSKPHVAMRPAFRALIRTLRSARKAGHSIAIRGQGDIERFLNASPDPSFDPIDFKERLRNVLTVASTAERLNDALELDRQISEVITVVGDGFVTVQIMGGPEWLTHQQIDPWLGTVNGASSMSSREAASWTHHLDGYNIGGQPIKVLSNHSLPTVRREDRHRQKRSGHQPWLPFWDEIGRFSATPKTIALQHAELFSKHELTILDPFCGLGGDSIAFALSGLNVIAAERDSSRLALARKNAHHFGVDSQIEFFDGDGLDMVKTWCTTNSPFGLFLDPPWGGRDWSQNPMDLDHLLPTDDTIRAAVQSADAVVFKLPRTFPTHELFELRGGWRFELGVATMSDHLADRIRTIQAFTATYCP
jgi:predicted RNA methylase